MSEHIILWEQKSSRVHETLWIFDEKISHPILKLTQDWGEDGKETVYFFLDELEAIVKAARAYMEVLDD